jgi:hypothetical protein
LTINIYILIYIKQILDLYQPVKYRKEKQEPDHYFDNGHSFDTSFPQPKWIMESMFRSMRQGLHLTNGKIYDWIVRSRYDFWLGDSLDLSRFDNFYYYAPNTTRKWWMFFDEIAVADVFGFSSENHMLIGSNVVNHIKGYYDEGVRYCGESMLGYHLHHKKIPVKFLRFNNIGLIREPNKAQCFHLHHQFDI